MSMAQTLDTERLKRVRKNRKLQMQRWFYYEHELKNEEGSEVKSKINASRKHIKFDKDIMLFEAVSRNDINEVKELLNQGVNPNATNIDGLTGLHQCCIDDFRDMADLLLKNHANVNSVDSEMWTPLHAAATCNNDLMCLLLSKYGCDFLALNADGNMPYDICEGESALKIIEMEMDKKGITQQQIDEARAVPERRMLSDLKTLYQNNANLDELDSQGAAMIHIACSLGYNEVVQSLLEAGADFSLPDKDGWLPIHLAACWSHIDIVEFLVVFGAKINLPNASGDTVFDLCEADVRDRLLYIKDNISEIRKNYNFSHIPPYKSFRRSRGSSIRRTSVRQKNMLSKKEAKEEFIALTQTISSTEERSELGDPISLTNIPSTIDECSDFDSTEANVKSQKLSVQLLKSESQNVKRIKEKVSSSPSSSSNDLLLKINTSARGKKNGSVVTDKITPESQSVAQSEANNIQKSKTLTENFEPEKKVVAPPRRASLVNIRVESNVEALDKPRYVFSSTSDSWENKEQTKNRRGKECCVLL